MSCVLAFENVTKTFAGEHIVIDEIDLAFEAGTSTALIGPNGTGKSTLLRIATGIMAPTSGVVRRRRRTTGLIDLGMSFHLDLSIRDNLDAALAMIGIASSRRKEVSGDVIEFADLGQALDVPIKHCSTGMVARLAAALAVNSEPEVLLLDEVLAVGDRKFQDRVLERVALLVAEGAAVVLVTHSYLLAEVATQRAVWLEDGIVMADGPTRGVLTRYDARRLGSSGYVANPIIRFGDVAVDPPQVQPGEGLLVSCVANVDSVGQIDFRCEFRPAVGDDAAWMRPNDEPVEKRHLSLVAATDRLRLTLRPGSHRVQFQVDSLPVTPTGLEVAVVAYAEDGRIHDVAVADLAVEGPSLRPEYLLNLRVVDPRD